MHTVHIYLHEVQIYIILYAVFQKSRIKISETQNASYRHLRRN